MTAPQPPKTYGDQHKTAADIQAMSSQQRDVYLDQYMSPSDRTAYLQDQAAQVGANDHSFLGLHGMMERIRAEAAAARTSQEITQQNVHQASSGDVQYVTGLNPSNTNYPGIDHATLKSYVDTNLDAAQVGELSDAYHQMSSIFNQFATTLSTAVNKSQGEWEGPAADSARNYFTSLQKWADANSQNSTLASEVVYQQSTAASTAKNSMPEPIPFSWSDEMKSWATSNPFNLVDNVQKSVEKAQQSQEAHDQAAQVMTTYDQGLYAAASKQPVFGEPPKFEASPGATSSQAAASIGSVGSGAGSVAGGVGTAGGHPGGYSSGTGAGSGSLSGSLAGLTGSPSLAAGAKTGGAYGSGTKPQSYQAPSSNFSPAASGGNSNNLSTLGGMPMGPMGGGFGPGGDEAYSSKLGRGAGGSFGPGGSAAESGSGSGSRATEAGAQTGARAGGAGAAESAAGGARGVSGASGRSGMSGMGGHGGKGKGGEDEEHQRPSWLIEPDPDDIFGTTERTAPPVIGE